MPGVHKSPLYKGIGKYKKKAKGKRGYTMACKKCGKAKSKCKC